MASLLDDADVEMQPLRTTRSDVSTHAPSPRVHNTEEALCNTSRRTQILTLFLILSWYVLSTMLSVFNKTLLGKKHGVLDQEPFPLPAMMTSVQFMTQHVMARCLHGAGVKRLATSDDSLTWAVYVRTILPNGIATGLDIGLSNKAFATITLSFYTMCKSSAPLFLLMFAFIWKLEKPSWSLAGIVLVISTGLLMLVSGEAEFELQGFILVMSAACLSGLRWTMTQVSLQGSSNNGSHTVIKGSALEVIEQLTPIMALITAFLAMWSEPMLHAWENSVYFDTWPHLALSLLLMATAAVIGLLMVWVEFRVIELTSSLTFMVAGVFKEILTLLIGHFQMGDQFSLLNGAGLVVLLSGVTLFNLHKYRHSQDPKGSNIPPSVREPPVPNGILMNDESDSLPLISDTIRTGKRLLRSISPATSPCLRPQNSIHQSE